MKNMNLNDWMLVELLPRDFAAAKYTVGQDLTEEQAKEIVRIIARSVNFKLDSPKARKRLSRIGSPYRDFVVCMILLMTAGESNTKWCDMLWFALDSNLRFACHNVMLGKMLGT